MSDTMPSNSWCPPGFPYPANTEPFAPCLATDPCSGDGVTTLWTFQPCVADPSTTTTAVVAVADPPVLPVTGVNVSEPVFGAVCVAIGVLLLATSKRKAAK